MPENPITDYIEWVLKIASNLITIPQLPADQLSQHFLTSAEQATDPDNKTLYYNLAHLAIFMTLDNPDAHADTAKRLAISVVTELQPRIKLDVASHLIIDSGGQMSPQDAYELAQSLEN